MKILGNTLCKVTDDDIVNGTVIIPNEIEFIGSEAFKDCKFLRYINLPSRVCRISDYAFKGCLQLKEINIPNGVYYIGIEAFYGCTALSNITIPEKVKTIKEKTFCNCVSLKSVKVIGTLERIEDVAFGYCENLRNFSITKNVKYLGNNAFYRCFKLNLYIETSLSEAFQGQYNHVIKDIDFNKLKIYHCHTTYNEAKMEKDSFGNLQKKSAFGYDNYMSQFIISARKEELLDIIKSKLNEKGIKGIKGIKYYKYKEHENFINEVLEKFYKLRDSFDYMLEIDNYVARYIKSCVKVRNNKPLEIEEVSNEIILRQTDDVVSECIEDGIDVRQDVSIDDNSVSVSSQNIVVQNDNSNNVISNEIVEQDDKESSLGNNYQHIFNKLSQLPDDEIALIRDMVKNDFFDENIERYINMTRKEKIEFLENQAKELNKQSKAVTEEKSMGVYKVSLEKEPIEVYKARQKQKLNNSYKNN